MSQRIDVAASFLTIARFLTAAVVVFCVATVLAARPIPFPAERLPFATFCIVAAIAIAGVCASAAFLSARAFLGIVAGFAFALRIGWLWAVPTEQVSDFAIYHELAAALARGQGYVITGPVGVEDLKYYIALDTPLPYATAFRPPGAPLWGAALYAMFGVNPRWFQLSNAVLGVLTTLLIYFCFPSDWRPGAGRAAASLWAMYPSSIAATGLWCTEVLYAFLICLIAVVLGTLRRSDRPGRWAAILGVLVAFTSLVRVGLAPLAIAVLAVILWKQRPGALRVAAVFLAFVCVGISPWVVRNWVTFGRFAVAPTLEGEVFARHTIEIVPDDVRRKGAAAYDRWRKVSNEFDKANQGYRLGRENLLAFLTSGPRHVAATIRKRFEVVFWQDSDMLRWSNVRSHALMIRPGPPVVMSAPLYDVLRRFFDGFYFVVLVAAVGGLLTRGFVAAARCSPGVAFLWASFLVGIGSVVPMGTLGRYHFGLMPFLCMLAGIGLERVGRAVTRRWVW